MIYNIVDIKWKGLPMSVLVCEKCSIPDYAVEIGKTITMENTQIIVCYVCLKKIQERR